MSFELLEPPINIGDEISLRSFEMIHKEAVEYEGFHKFSNDEKAIVERLIHTTTCFDQVIDNMFFTPNSITKLNTLLERKAKLIVDTNMIRAGLSKFYLDKYENEVICYVNEPEVFEMAKVNKTTRSYAAVQLAIEKFRDEPLVLACGNAPTFIYAAINALLEKKINLDNVTLLLFPVGFVNVVESKAYGKKFLEEFNADGMILEGRYGASTMIVASIHAAYKLIKDYDTETESIMASSLTNSHASSQYGSNPVKEGEVRLNEMGSEVVEGYTCKPKDYDPNRAIMHYKTLLLLCDDERCGKAGKDNRATHLRELLKDMGLNKGANRIKISRTGCYGACRYRQVCQVTENTQANGNAENNALWLKHTHQFKDEDWINIFKLLSDNKTLTKELDKENFIPMKVYE